MKVGTTMSYHGEYTARVLSTVTKEEDWYRPFPTIEAARGHVEQRHGPVVWLRFSDYSRHYAAKTHRHHVK